MQHSQSFHVHLGPRHDNSTSVCCSTPAPPTALTLQKKQDCFTAEMALSSLGEGFCALQTAGVGLPYGNFLTSGGHCKYLMREYGFSLERDHQLLIFYYFSINSICFSIKLLLIFVFCFCIPFPLLFFHHSALSSAEMKRQFRPLLIHDMGFFFFFH